MRRSAVSLAFLAALCGFALLLPQRASRAGVSGSPHDYGQAGPWSRSLIIAPSGSCSACHAVHGARQGSSLWVNDLSGYISKLLVNGGISGQPNYVLPGTIACYDCHDDHSSGTINDVPPINEFNSSHRPQNILFGFTIASPGSGSMSSDGPGGMVAGFYENMPPDNTSGNYGANPNLRPLLPPYPSDNTNLLKTGGHYFKRSDPTGVSGDGFDIGDKLPCRDCHDPHVWASTRQAFIRQTWPAGTHNLPARLSPPNWGGSASQHMANSLFSGSRSDSDSRAVCIACHGAQQGAVGYSRIDPATFNEINTAYFSTSPVVTPPASVVEHQNGNPVACVECHRHNSVDASCGDCHGFPPPHYSAGKNPESGASYGRTPEKTHAVHFGKENGQSGRFSPYDFRCAVCHARSAMGTQSPGNHGNDNADINYDFSQWGVANPVYPPPMPFVGSTYTRAVCNNVWCHSLGNDNASMPGYYRSVTWGQATLGCNGCHGVGTTAGTAGYGMPNYQSGPAGGLAANSHLAHVVTNGYECTVCHFNTVSGTFTSGRTIKGAPAVTAWHVNHVQDVAFDPAVVTIGAAYPTGYDNNTKRCDVACHGTGKSAPLQPQWGDQFRGDCFKCHGGVEAYFKPLDLAAVPNPVSSAEYTQSGHGRRGTAYPVSNNPAAGKWDNSATGSWQGCYRTDSPAGCHDTAAAHLVKNSNDPFRLGAGQTYADCTVGLCLLCHGAAGPAQTRNMQQHTKAITGGPLSTKAWPGGYDWKCVDCHDPHGDGNDNSLRVNMVRSAINNPTGSDNGNVGSDVKGRPLRNPGWTNILFTDNTGYAGNGTTTGSYAIPGTSNWGICEGCHRQVSAYSQFADNSSTHSNRTGKCTTCHPHDAGFGPKACKGCHGPDGTLPNAPIMSAHWATSGHGKTGIAVECEACHDVGFLNPTDHKTTVPGTPPANINTENWPGKTQTLPDTQPTINTAHLRPEFFPGGTGYPAGVTNRYQFAQTFDGYCNNPKAGCHQTALNWHHWKNQGNPPTNAMRYGDGGTTTDPKQYSWLTMVNYQAGGYYLSQSPWVDNDLSSVLSGLAVSDRTTIYSVCVSCHDPHGTGTTDRTRTGGPNAMVRWNWRSDPSTFCTKACHRSP